MEKREYRAAGGILLDDGGRVLVIERWVLRDGLPAHEIRLPKGHVEAGETDQEAAVRETCEETGYCDVEVIADLGTYLTGFVLSGEQVVRHEHYYLMRLTDAQREEPHFDPTNTEEARFRPRWVANLAEAEAQITYESEREFTRRARRFAASLIR